MFYDVHFALHFNPRPPRGGRPVLLYRIILYNSFQSTPPARGATIVVGPRLSQIFISIHAPREGGDTKISL